MKPVIMTALVLLSVVFLLPMFLFGVSGSGAVLDPSPSGGISSSARPIEQMAAGGRDGGRQVSLYHRESGEIEFLSMADYLWGVVAAEMPAAFHSEALKAQCVAARTYTLRKGAGITADHPDVMVCDDITCCQAYITRKAAMELWGSQGAFYQEKIDGAVARTDGLVVTCGGNLIDAVFHSSSQGSTADAAEVWGRAVSYLVPVNTPEGEEVPDYHTTVRVSPEEFAAKIQSRYPQANFGEDPAAWFGEPTYTAAGAVGVLPAGGARVTGLEYRTLFGLRSARFTLSVNEQGIGFHVTGYGHGVGMSQYGANALAGAGMGFEEILKHYYTGCNVTGIR